jgi:hypothetical protein
VDPRVGLDVTEKRKNLLPLPGNEPQFLDFPAGVLVSVVTDLAWFLLRELFPMVERVCSVYLSLLCRR